MIRSLINLARGSLGIYSQLRRLVAILEHNLEAGIVVRGPGGIYVVEGSLPATKSEIKIAAKEQYESIPYDEEAMAGEAVKELLLKRRRGEDVSEHPGKDWSPY
jgi:hypothetical protein